jgi:hypothetical protein
MHRPLHASLSTKQVLRKLIHFLPLLKKLPLKLLRELLPQKESRPHFQRQLRLQLLPLFRNQHQL